LGMRLRAYIARELSDLIGGGGNGGE
jgi:hypothetical protein